MAATLYLRPNQPFKLGVRLLLQLHVSLEDGIFHGDEFLLAVELFFFHGPDVILQVLELGAGRDHGGADVERINLRLRNVKNPKMFISTFTSIFWQRRSSFFFKFKT